MIRIGIDFGKTIGLIEEDNPYENCYNVINFMRNKYEKENIFIISKAKQEMRVKITNWLLNKKFFEETKLLKENLIFCNDYEDKAKIVAKLKINVFIDDHIKVIQSIAKLEKIKKLIWFNKKADIRLIEKENREKVIISNKWSKIVKIFQNIN